MKKDIKTLIKALHKEKFNWRRYIHGRMYRNLYLTTGFLFCSYGSIGCTISINNGEHEVCWDWELNEITYDDNKITFHNGEPYIGEEKL